MSLLIKGCTVGNRIEDIYIEDERIVEIGKVRLEADFEIDATRMAALPGFINTHTHAAMTLFRGWGDDLELDRWLNDRIWPMEEKLTSDLVYWGTKLACLEMIRGGTTAFMDMYYHPETVARAVGESGIRGFLGPVFLDKISGDTQDCIREGEATLRKLRKTKGHVYPVLCPHTVYTCTEELLGWCADHSREQGIPVHFHLLETETENIDFKGSAGRNVTDFLEHIGFLHEGLVAAHCAWANKRDIALLGKNRVNVSFNPTSNMKLSVGNTMNAPAMEKAGVNVCLGTDGPASNNSLSMFEAMKFGGLAVKNHYGDPTLCDADTLFRYATGNGARALSLDSGTLEADKLADIILLDLRHETMVPTRHSLASKLAYGASPEAVQHVICNGKLIMKNRNVTGAGETVEGFEMAVNRWFDEHDISMM